MSREPIFAELADNLADTMRHRSHRKPVPADFEHDLRHLPVFAATIRTRGWNGLHLRPQTPAITETATLEVIR